MKKTFENDPVRMEVSKCILILLNFSTNSVIVPPHFVNNLSSLGILYLGKPL